MTLKYLLNNLQSLYGNSFESELASTYADITNKTLNDIEISQFAKWIKNKIHRLLPLEIYGTDEEDTEIDADTVEDIMYVFKHNVECLGNDFLTIQAISQNLEDGATWSESKYNPVTNNIGVNENYTNAANKSYNNMGTMVQRNQLMAMAQEHARLLFNELKQFINVFGGDA